MPLDLDDDADSQDMAETFDETNITPDGEDIAHPDIEPDVFDVTTAEDDADDEDLDGDDYDDFDPDNADDAELDSMLERDDGVDKSHPSGPDMVDRVSSDHVAPAALQDGQRQAHPITERHLDAALEDTFPASDPVSTSPGAD